MRRSRPTTKKTEDTDDETVFWYRGPWGEGKNNKITTQTTTRARTTTTTQTTKGEKDMTPSFGLGARGGRKTAKKHEVDDTDDKGDDSGDNSDDAR